MEPISMGAALLGSAGISAGSSLLGSFINRFTDNSESLQQREYERQKEFAQNQLQWRAADAEKAGLSKFAALGGQSSFYTPSYSGSSSGFGDAVAQAGQGVSRALETYALASQREALEGQRLDNENKSLELMLKKQEFQNQQFNASWDFRFGNKGAIKTFSKSDQEMMEDSVFATPARLQALIDTLDKNPAGAFRSLTNASSELKDTLLGVDEHRQLSGMLKSMPTFKDISVLSQARRSKLYNQLYQLGYFDAALNDKVATRQDIYNMIMRGDTDFLNNIVDPETMWSTTGRKSDRKTPKFSFGL